MTMLRDKDIRAGHFLEETQPTDKINERANTFIPGAWAYLIANCLILYSIIFKSQSSNIFIWDNSKMSLVALMVPGF